MQFSDKKTREKIMALAFLWAVFATGFFAVVSAHY